MLNHKARYSENDFGVGGKKKKPDWQVYEAGMDDGAMGSPMAAITNLFGGGGKKEDARGSSGSGKSSGAKSENNNIKFASFRARKFLWITTPPSTSTSDLWMVKPASITASSIPWNETVATSYE
jgi:hypothetical protein